jgi:hypothetical protein
MRKQKTANLDRCPVPGLVKPPAHGPRPKLLRPDPAMFDHEAFCDSRYGAECNCEPKEWIQPTFRWED